MRAGPNESERFIFLRDKIYELGTVDDAFTAYYAQFAVRWPVSYRTPLQLAGTGHAEKYDKWAEGAEDCCMKLRRSETMRCSAETYQTVLDWLGGKAPFTAYQICLDIGYKHPRYWTNEVSNPGEHLVKTLR
eukprot:SAG22_NODE_7301_length_752_cov_6.752294_1_plen_132_part_00